MNGDRKNQSIAPSRRRPVAPPIYSLERQVKDWNLQHPIGTAVIVSRDNGTEQGAVTRSAAWLLSGHSAVIMVTGISGCYSLDRVRPATISKG